MGKGPLHRENRGLGEAGFAVAEANTPVCSLGKFMADYAKAWDVVHAPLMKELGMPSVRPTNFARDPASRGLFTEVNAGIRKLDWCPERLTLLYHLFPFLAARNISISTPAGYARWVGDLRTTADAWVVSSDKPLFRNEDDHRRSIPASGFFGKVVVPDAVQLTYLIVESLYRRRDIGMASEPEGKLLYARTATRTQDNHLVGIAYVKNRFVSYRLFDPCKEHPDLMVMDVIILT